MMPAFLWIKSDNQLRVGIAFLVNRVAICSNLTENQPQKWSVYEAVNMGWGKSDRHWSTWLIHIQNHCCGFERFDRILLQMLPFVLMLGLHPRPDQLVEHTAQLRFAGNYYFLNSEELNFTICFHHSLKCTKIDCGWGSAPDPAGGAYRAPRKIIVWISKVFIPSNALYSCRMRQTLVVGAPAPEPIRRAI